MCLVSNLKGLSPKCVDEAKAKGVSLALRYIPKEVFDKRAVDKNQVVFYDIAFVEVQPVIKGRKVTVKLKDFGVSYRQDDIDVPAGEITPCTQRTLATRHTPNKTTNPPTLH